MRHPLIDSARADSIALVRQDSINRAQPGYIVDSILPMDEQLRRFRAGLKESPRALNGTAHSKDSAGARVRASARIR